MSLETKDRGPAAETSRNGVHRFAILTAVATFPLLMLGGIVTSLEVGLAVPDWPTTFGYQMFLYPIGKMLESTGVFWEHSHRLMGSIVGLLTVGLALWIWRQESRRWVRWLGFAALVGVCIQGVLGGLRVTLIERVLAVVHGSFAQAFFCLVVVIAVVTAPGWRQAPPAEPRSATRRVRRLALVTTGALYGQLILGALVRHLQMSVLAHVAGALIVAVLCSLTQRSVRRSFADVPALAKPARRLVTLLGIQILLGIVTWLAVRNTVPGAAIPIADVVSATSHVLVGALLLMTSVTLLTRTYRFAAEPRLELPVGEALSDAAEWTGPSVEIAGSVR